MSDLDRRRAKATDCRGIERRTASSGTLELRQADNGGLRLSGYPALTEHWYDVGDPARGGFRERLSRSAFKRTLGESPDVQLLVNHSGLALGRTRSPAGGAGTLRLAEDERGLRMEADLDPEDPAVQSLVRAIRRRDVTQMSFAFTATDQTWSEDYSRRTLRSVSLHRGDVSVVNQGANAATSVMVVDGEPDRPMMSVAADGRSDPSWPGGARWEAEQLARLRAMRAGWSPGATGVRSQATTGIDYARLMRERQALARARSNRRD